MLRDWLPRVVQASKPWMSEHDIAKGGRWGDEIASHLDSARFGILCVTPENVGEPWVNFEAGALSVKIGENQVAPLLLCGLKPSQIVGPLAQFQQTVVSDKEDMLRLMASLNDVAGDAAVRREVLKDVFGRFWSDLESLIAKLGDTDVATPPERSEREMLEEVLETVRGLHRAETSRGLVTLVAPPYRSEGWTVDPSKIGVVGQPVYSAGHIYTDYSGLLAGGEHGTSNVTLFSNPSGLEREPGNVAADSDEANADPARAASASPPDPPTATA
jgi:hypothetical protein